MQTNAGEFGSRALRFCRSPPLSSDIVVHFQNLHGTARDALVKLASGRNSGRPRSCTPEPLKDFTCTHPTYRKRARLQIGSSPYTGNSPQLRCTDLTIRNNGTLCIFLLDQSRSFW